MSARERLIGRFREVAVERLTRLSNDWVALETDPSQAAITERLLREAHTLKGESRMLGFRLINDVIHAVEEVMHASLGAGRAATTDEAQRVVEGLDLCGALVPLDPAPAEPWPARVAAFVTVVDEEGREAPGEPSAVPAVSPNAKAAAREESQAPAAPEPDPSDAGAPAAQPAEPSQSVGERRGLRIDQAELDALSTLAGRVARGQERRRRELIELRRALAELRPLLPAGAGSRLRGLDLALRRIAEGMAEDGLRLEHVNERVEAMRYLSVGSLFAAFPRVARDVAVARGRRVRVQRVGESVSLDGEVLERLREPLLHLVRNAVDHGIEDPDDRRRGQGKDPRRHDRAVRSRHELARAGPGHAFADDGQRPEHSMRRRWEKPRFNAGADRPRSRPLAWHARGSVI